MTLAADPVATEPRWRGVRAPLGTAAGIALATAALRLRDPHRQGSWGWCPFKEITGWNCPFCGGLRAVNDLTHLRVEAAWHSNTLFLALLPLIAAGWLVWVRRSWRGKGGPVGSVRVQRVTTAVLSLAALAFTVFRNTPAGQAFQVS